MNGEESMTICSAVLIQYQRVTDGRTDRQTDRIGIAKTCFSIPADARNKKDGYRQLNVRQLCSLRHWDNRGKCYMDRKRI